MREPGPVNCQKLGLDQVGSWRTHPGKKSEPSLEAGTSWMAEDVKGMGEWALPLSHICMGQGQQKQGEPEHSQP